MNPRTPILVLAFVSLIVAAGLESGLGTTGLAAPPQPESISTPAADGPAARAADEASATLLQSPPTETGPDGRPEALSDGDSALRMQVVRVAPCGSTCRDVTAKLHNEGAVDLTNVEVYTTIYAGDQIVWVDAERVGTITAGDTYTTTKRVRVAAGDVLKIHSNGGAVTVKTVLEFDQGSEVVTEQVEVL